MPKPVLPTKRRRKGFESVRKDSCSADARLRFFENEKVCCKLTAASAIQKGLLHVSFGAVGSLCRGGFIRSFSLLIGLSEAENLPFSQTKSFPFIESFTNFTQSRFFTHKNFFCTCLSSLSEKFPIFTNQKPFFCTNLSLFPPKAILFHPPLPIPTTLNLLSAKNTAVLLLFALILCCKAGTSHRFKSLPAISGKLLFSALPVT